MIPLAERVPYYRFGLKEERQLLLLLTLHDLDRGASGRDVLQHLRKNHYLRGKELFLYPTLGRNCVRSGYVHRQNNTYTVSDRGLRRLRDLCELANAMESRIRKLTTTAMIRVQELRQTADPVPFTSFVTVNKTPRAGIPGSKRDHHVYVILLSNDVINGRTATINPQRDPNRPALYVGMTSATPKIRFARHKHGVLHSWEVRDYGLCLVPDLYFHLNPLTEWDAPANEKHLAHRLRKSGFAVLAGHHDYDSKGKILV